LKKIIAVIASLLFINTQALAVDPGLDWKTIENEHIYVHYADGNKAFAERALAIAEAAHQRLTEELNWHPVDKTHIVLSDEIDHPNGYATPLFFNRTVLYYTPPTSINTLEDFDDWFSTLVFHEYTHIVHLDKADGSPDYLRNVFGRFFFLFPNVYQPSWVLEGLATHKETYPERGIGRGQSAMFASMMRAEVANGVQPISHVNLPVNTWPAGTTRYLYGVYFMNFLAEKYGEEQMQEWVEEYSDNLIPFFINTTAKQSLGKNLTPLWEEFEQWLIAQFQPQIDRITAEGIRAGEQVSSEAYRTDSVRTLATEQGEVTYYIQNSGYKHASLVRINADNSIEDLTEVNGSSYLDLHPDAGLLLTQDEFCNNYTIYRDIYRYHEDSNRLERLTECGRYLYASWHPDGEQIFAVHHDAARISLHLLDENAQLKEVLWQATDDEVIGQVDVSPDGQEVVAAVWRRGSGWNIEMFDLYSRNWSAITHGTDIVANPQYTDAGDILFTREHQQVYNLNRYEVATGLTVQLTNLIGGAFQSSQSGIDGTIYYTGYTADGYAIFKLDDTTAFTDAANYEYTSLEIIEYEVGDHQEQEYSAISNFYPRWWFPTLGLSEQRTEIGITTTGADALDIHKYSLSLSYDTKLEAPAGSITYAYADRFAISGQRLNEITVDSNGDLFRLSKRHVASAVVAFPKNFILNKYNLLFSTIYDRTSDERLTAGAMPLPDFEDYLLGVAGLYQSTHDNPLSISENDGARIRLVAEDSDLLDSDFTGQVYTLDWRQFIRTGRESVLALRFVQGWGTDNPRPFKLGGEGSSDNIIDILFNGSGDPVFNVRDYALRGYQEGRLELQGRRMQLLSGEWRFPLQRIEDGVMLPPVGIMQWFGNVFTEVGSAYQDSPEKYYPGAGLEVTADISLFYNLILRTRLGFAHGFDEDIGANRVYLKVGSSF
jgi:hypothetical protein